MVAPPPTDGAASDNAGPFPANERRTAVIRPYLASWQALSLDCRAQRVRWLRGATCIVSDLAPGGSCSATARSDCRRTVTVMSCRWPTRHDIRASVVLVRILGSGTAVGMTASPGWE